MRDAVIVLSHRLETDGGISDEYKQRLSKAIELVLDKKAKHIVLCSETATPAIRDYLINQGIEDILLQPYSTDTVQEAIYTKLLLPDSWRSLFVVSSDYHIRYRVGLIFDAVFGRHFDIEYIEVETNRVRNRNTMRDQMKSLEAFLENSINSV